MKNRKRRALSIVSFLSATLGIASCESWPPGKDAITAEFAENRQQIERLLHEFQDSSYDEITHGGASGGATGIDSATDAYVTLPPQDGKAFQILLEQARVDTVTRANSSTIFLLPTDPIVGGRIVRVQFVHRTSGSELPICDDFTKADSGVKCEYHLDDDWFLSYFWTSET